MLTAIDGPLTAVHSSAKHDVGSLYHEAGKTYIYLKGVASTAAGDVVTYLETGVTARANKTEVDKLLPCAVALAAVVADKYGWYQIFGETNINTAAACAKEVAVYTHNTAGAIDDVSTSQTKINRMILRAAASGAAKTAAYICFPSAA